MLHYNKTLKNNSIDKHALCILIQYLLYIRALAWHVIHKILLQVNRSEQTVFS